MGASAVEEGVRGGGHGGDDGDGEEEEEEGGCWHGVEMQRLVSVCWGVYIVRFIESMNWPIMKVGRQYFMCMILKVVEAQKETKKKRKGVLEQPYIR